MILLVLLFYGAGMIIFDLQHLFYWKMWRPVCSDIFRALLAVPPLYYLVTYWFEYGIWLMTAACLATAVTIRLESYWQYMLGTFLGLAVLFASSDMIHAGLSLSALPQLVLTGLLLGSPYTALTAGVVFIVRKRQPRNL